MSSRVATLAKGSALRSFSFCATSIVAIILMPFIIHSLGDRLYGLWILIGSFLGFYGLLDFGLSIAVERYISKAIGSHHYKEANKVINSSFLIFSIIGLVAFLISMIAIIITPLFIKNILEISLFRKVIFILGSSLAIGFPMRVFTGTLISYLRYDLVSSIELAKLAIRTFLIVTFLKMGYGILMLAAVTFCVDSLGYICSFIITKKIVPFMVFSKMFLSKKHFKSLFSYSIFTFISHLATILRFYTSYFIIAYFMGVSFVTLYSIASRLIKYFSKFIFSIVGLGMPVFSQYESRNDFASIREKYIFLTRITGYLSSLIGGTLIIFGNCFIRRWIGQDYAGVYPILVILVIPFIFDLIQIPSAQALYGISKHKFYALLNLIEGVSILILGLMLVRKFGLIGVALGTAIPMMIVRPFIQPIYTCKCIGLELRKYYFEVLGPIILKSVIILGIFWGLTRNFIMPSFLNLSMLVSCEIILFSGIIFFIGLNKSEQGYFKKLIFRT